MLLKTNNKVQKRLNKINMSKYVNVRINLKKKLLWFELYYFLTRSEKYCRYLTKNPITKLSRPSNDPTDYTIYFKCITSRLINNVLPDYRLVFTVPILNDLNMVEDILLKKFINIMRNRFIFAPILIEFFSEKKKIFRYKVKKTTTLLYNDMYMVYLAVYRQLLSKYKISKLGFYKNVDITITFPQIPVAIEAYRKQALIPTYITTNPKINPNLMFKVANWSRFYKFKPFKSTYPWRYKKYRRLAYLYSPYRRRAYRGRRLRSKVYIR